MLSLDSPDWADLQHAYGSAADIPDLLRQLEILPDSAGRTEPWFSIWSALAHQGDIYTASFAAVPHVVRIFRAAPDRAPAVFLQFAAWVEICRHNKSVAIPDALSKAYAEAISSLPDVVCAASNRTWDFDFLLSAISAISVAKGFSAMAEAMMDMTPQDVLDYRIWLDQR